MTGTARSVVLGGLTGFGLSLMFAWIPAIGPALCCATLFATGLLAVWHRVATTGEVVPSGDGARMGAQAGLVAFVASTVLMLVSWLAAGRPNLASQIRGFEDQGVAELDPRMLDLAAKALDTPEVVLGMVVAWVLVYSVFGTIGGAVGAGVFRRADRPPNDPNV